jgi:tripartite-type tricarboxylate transporter receptor subunit TctC
MVAPPAARLGARRRWRKTVLGGSHAVQWNVALALTIVPVNIAAAQASNFPNHAIKIIVGPSPDVFSRIVAEHLQQAWGQPVIVEPRLGAGGKLAATAAQFRPGTALPKD